MPKQVKVHIVTMEHDLEFSIDSDTKGKQLIELTARTIGLREIWYFGLRFIDSKDLSCWLKLNDKVLAQDVKTAFPMVFEFRVAYFPEDVSELIEETTQNLFFLQIKEAILTEELFCPPETSVLLASYALQAKYSDWSAEMASSGVLFKDRVLPQRIIDQHKLTINQWYDRISSWYSEHAGMSKAEAMMEYLRVAQDLDMYGITYFEIRNRKGTALWLGIDALGLNIFEKSNKLNGKLGFPWSEIQNVSFSNKKFIIKPTDLNAPDFIFFVDRVRINKQILTLCQGNHELYVRRRGPESKDLQFMRSQVQQAKLLKEANRNSLSKERHKKEEVELQKQELEHKLKKYETDFHKVQTEVRKAQELAMKMKVEVQKVEQKCQELKEAHRRAEEAKLQAEEVVFMEKAERERREHEANDAIVLLEMKMAEWVQAKDTTEKLQSELERTRTEGLQTLELMQTSKQLQDMEEMQRSDEQTEHTESVERQEKKPFVLTSQVSDTFQSDDKAPEETVTLSVETNRGYIADRQSRIDDHLKKLSSELSAAKDRTRLTRNDVLYMQNVLQGRDKYKTLRQIRLGNTKQRVEVFEAM